MGKKYNRSQYILEMDTVLYLDMSYSNRTQYIFELDTVL